MPNRSNDSEFQPSPPYMRGQRAGRTRHNTQEVASNNDWRAVLDVQGHAVGVVPIVHIDKTGDRTLWHHRVPLVRSSIDPSED